MKISEIVTQCSDIYYDKHLTMMSIFEMSKTDSAKLQTIAKITYFEYIFLSVSVAQMKFLKESKPTRQCSCMLQTYIEYILYWSV